MQRLPALPAQEQTVPAAERAKRMRVDNDPALEEMARARLQKEVLDREELEAIVAEFASTKPEAAPSSPEAIHESQASTA